MTALSYFNPISKNKCMSNIKRFHMTGAKLLKGVILLDKPKGMSSREACEAVKRMVGGKKAGDSGTLDDNTTGLLLICLDEATKAMPLLIRLNKEYVTTIQLHQKVEQQKVLDALKFFTGEVEQLPPIRSAVARKLRVRQVYSIDVLSMGEMEIKLKIKCEAGFYVRKFAHDLGQKLGCGAQMTALRRTAIHSIKDSECVKLEDVSREKIIPIETILRRVGVKKVFVNENALNNARHGIGLMSYHIDGMDDEIKEGDSVAIIYKKNIMIGIGKAVKDFVHYKRHRKSRKAYQYILPDRVINF